jgi:hypothetical protein
MSNFLKERGKCAQIGGMKVTMHLAVDSIAAGSAPWVANIDGGWGRMIVIVLMNMYRPLFWGDHSLNNIWR